MCVPLGVCFTAKCQKEYACGVCRLVYTRSHKTSHNEVSWLAGSVTYRDIGLLACATMRAI